MNCRHQHAFLIWVSHPKDQKECRYPQPVGLPCVGKKPPVPYIPLENDQSEKDSPIIKLLTESPELQAEEKINFHNVKNDDLIKFVLMTQNKNINSKKPLQKKIALQNKLINLFKERQVSHSIDGINIDSGYWKISFKRCMWNENNDCLFYKPEWTGTEWTYEDISNELNFAEDDSKIDLEQGTLTKTWWKSGQKKSEGYIKDGKRNGKWQGWHPNGEDRYVRYYENGEIEESFEYEMTN